MHDEEARHRASKDRKTWCRGKEGAYHQTALVPVHSEVSTARGGKSTQGLGRSLREMREKRVLLLETLRQLPQDG